MTKNILVVCLGNICRSPLAQAILQTRLDEAGLNIKIEGAGTGGWHVGDPPDARAIVAARLKGYDLTQMRARRATVHDFNDFDMILTMDHSVTHDMEALRPIGDDTPIQLVTNYADAHASVDVPDPYYTGKFNQVIDMLEASAAGLVDQLRKARQ